MDSRFNIYFNGQILDGQNLDDVRARMAKLFNANPATLEKLFSGKTQLIKRDCDQATALKFKQAIAGAGGLAIIKASSEQATPTASAPQPAAAPPPPEKPMTAAERIAALAGAPDQGSYAPTAAPAASQGQTRQDDSASDSFQVEPVGSDVLRAEERAQVMDAKIDTSALSVDEHVERLSAEPKMPPPAPDTSHLSMGETGDTIPTLATAAAPLNPNTDALSLVPGGADLSDCAPPAAEPLALDLSAIEIAPPGAEVLEAQFRRKHDEPAPPTDHLSLED